MIDSDRFADYGLPDDTADRFVEYELTRQKRILLDKHTEMVVTMEIRPRIDRPVHRNESLTPPPNSGYQGVTWNRKSGRWIVQAQVDGRIQYWGSFLDAQEAAVRYDAVVLHYRGARAKTHLIPNPYLEGG